jgi:hypothetical protein
MIKQFNSIYYGVDGDNGGGDVDNYVVMTDPFTQQPVKVPKELESFIGHVATSNRKAGKSAIKNDLDTVNEQLEETKAEVMDLRGKLKNAGSGDKQIENIKAEYEKMIDELKKGGETKASEADKWRSQFEEYKVLNDINAALSGYDLFNAQQTVDLIRTQGKAKLHEKIDLATGAGTGQFETKLVLNLPDESGAMTPVELGASDAIKKFFALENNAFHLKNKLTPGGGSTGSNLNNGGVGKVTRGAFDSMTPIQKEQTIKMGVQITEQ